MSFIQHFICYFVSKQNYGASFELMPAGIVGGPVKLVSAHGNTIDLSNNTWTYKVKQSIELCVIVSSDFTSSAFLINTRNLC